MFFSQATIALFAIGFVTAAPAVEKRAAITDGNQLFRPPSRFRTEKMTVSSVTL